MRVKRNDFQQVAATEAERAAYNKRKGRSPVATPSVPRAVHKPCGQRIWYSGIGIGSHLRSCPGAPGTEDAPDDLCGLCGVRRAASGHTACSTCA